MASSQSIALKHWARIIKRWPVDKVRPENVAFQTIMQNRIKKLTGPPPAVKDVKANEALVSANQPDWNEQAEMKQVNVLYMLLENSIDKKYPLPSELRHPASNPTHYDNVVREMQEAPSRSWLGGLVKRISGSLRFS